MLTLQTYSELVSLGCISLLLISVFVFILFFLNKKFQNIILNQDYFVFLKSIFVLVLISIVGALIYQEIYLTPVCPLCWQQRMLIYAVGIISLVSIYIKDKLAHYSIFAISAFGLWIAANHYYYHYVKYVLGDLISLPCDAEGIACSESPIGAVFGFVTIPFMSLSVFIPFLVLAFFAYRNLQNNK